MRPRTKLTTIMVTVTLLLISFFPSALWSSRPLVSAAVTPFTNMPTPLAAFAAATAPTGVIYAIGGWNGSNSIATVEALDPATGIWSTKTSMPTARNGLGAVTASNGKIYAIGGFNCSCSWMGGPTLATVEEYDPTADTWVTKASMPTARTWPGVAAANNGKIYVIGGFDGNRSLPTVEQYDPATDTWTRKADMPTPRWNLGVVTASDGKIYAIGGQSDGSLGWQYYTTVEAYDPTTDTWTKKTNMPTARGYFGLAAANNGNLYAIGGWNNYSIAAVEEYNPATDTWATKTSMPTARNTLAVATAPSGVIYAMGGQINGSGTIATVEAYDPGTNTWTTASSTPAPTDTPTNTLVPMDTPTATVASTPTPTDTPTSAPPGGKWISPTNNFTTSGNTLHFAAHADPATSGGSAIDHVTFTAWWPGINPNVWYQDQKCTIYAPAPGTDQYACDLDLSKVAPGPLMVSFNVYDKAGNSNLAPNGVHSGTVPSTWCLD